MRSSTCWRNSTRSHAVTRPCAPTDPARSRPSPSGTRPRQGARRRRRSRAQKPPKAAEPLAADHRHGVPPADRGRLGTKRVAGGGHRHPALSGASDLLASEVGAVAGGRGVGRGGGHDGHSGGRRLDRGWPVRSALLATQPIDPARPGTERLRQPRLACGKRGLPQASRRCHIRPVPCINRGLRRPRAHRAASRTRARNSAWTPRRLRPSSDGTGDQGLLQADQVRTGWGFAADGTAALDSRAGDTFHWWPSSVMTVTDFLL